MTAEIYEFINRGSENAQHEEGDMEALKGGLKEWHIAQSGCTRPLTALVWHEVDSVLRTDAPSLIRNVSAAVKDLMSLYTYEADALALLLLGIERMEHGRAA